MCASSKHGLCVVCTQVRASPANIPVILPSVQCLECLVLPLVLSRDVVSVNTFNTLSGEIRAQDSAECLSEGCQRLPLQPLLPPAPVLYELSVRAGGAAILRLGCDVSKDLNLPDSDPFSDGECCGRIPHASKKDAERSLHIAEGSYDLVCVCVCVCACVCA